MMSQSGLLQRQYQNNDNNMMRPLRAAKRPRRRIDGAGDAVASPNLDLPFLPDDVVEKIFSFLPIKQAVRNGVVSKSLGQSWVMNRHIIFDRAVAGRIRTRSELINIVDGVFQAHKGPQIKTFHLYFDHAGVDRRVYGWVRKAIEKGVEDLDLDFYLALIPFQFSFYFLGAKTLRTVKLSYCDIGLPRAFNKRLHLTTVALKKVTLAEWVVELLVRQCPGLESLSLAQCHVWGVRIFGSELKRFRELKIGGCPDLRVAIVDAPTLVAFHYQGPARCLVLNDSVSNLEDVIFNFTPSRAFSQYSCKIDEIANNLMKNVTVLSASSAFIEGLPSIIQGGITRGFQANPWNALKELQLSMEANSFCNLTDVASLLASCTNLEKLFIDLNNFQFESGTYWELHQKQIFESSDTILSSLKFIKIRSYKFLKHEVELVRFLLQRSLILQELVLVWPRGSDYEVSLDHAYMCSCHFHSCRLSKLATITVLEHYHDKSCEPKHSKINWFK